MFRTFSSITDSSGLPLGSSSSTLISPIRIEANRYYILLYKIINIRSSFIIKGESFINVRELLFINSFFKYQNSRHSNLYLTNQLSDIRHDEWIKSSFAFSRKCYELLSLPAANNYFLNISSKTLFHGMPNLSWPIQVFISNPDHRQLALI